MQTGLHLLWDVNCALVGFRVATILQQLSLILSEPGVCCQITPDGHTEEAPLEKKFSAHASRCCSQGKREEAVQDPCAMLHWVVASKKLEPSETCIPALDPVSGELASGHMGPKPQVGQASACPISGPVHAGQS